MFIRLSPGSKGIFVKTLLCQPIVISPLQNHVVLRSVNRERFENYLSAIYYRIDIAQQL